MAVRRISDYDWNSPCHHREHYPPRGWIETGGGFVALKPGLYEHECPACCGKLPFVVQPVGVGSDASGSEVRPEIKLKSGAIALENLKEKFKNRSHKS